MSGKGIPESGTIRLSDIREAYGDVGSFIGANTFSSAANGTVTAPSTASWVIIELYGAGGGGNGYESATTEYGGGGGSFVRYSMPVTGGTTQFGYRVGNGGAGGTIGNPGTTGGVSYANTSIYGGKNNGTLYAYGGGGGRSDAGGFSGTPDAYVRGPSANVSMKKRVESWANGEIGGVGYYGYGGDAGGSGGGAGATTSGGAGSSPGGGGAGRWSSSGSGGAGAAGRVAFLWYGASGTDRLRDFIGGGSILDRTATGNNKNIPVSGTLRLKDFYSSDELGYRSNNLPGSSGSSGYQSADFDSVSSGTATATANIAVLANGHITHSYNWGTPFDRGLSDSVDTELLSRFQIQFTRTSGDALTGGSATNTWITMNFLPKWILTATRSVAGTSAKLTTGYLRFRRVDNNQEVVNVAASLSAWAEYQSDFDTK